MKAGKLTLLKLLTVRVSSGENNTVRVATGFGMLEVIVESVPNECWLLRFFHLRISSVHPASLSPSSVMRALIVNDRSQYGRSVA